MRRLWGNGRGRFRTRSSRVVVSDLVRGRNITLLPGRSYLAKAGRLKR